MFKGRESRPTWFLKQSTSATVSEDFLTIFKLPILLIHCKKKKKHTHTRTTFMMWHVFSGSTGAQKTLSQSRQTDMFEKFSKEYVDSQLSMCTAAIKGHHPPSPLLWFTMVTASKQKRSSYISSLELELLWSGFEHISGKVTRLWCWRKDSWHGRNCSTSEWIIQIFNDFYKIAWGTTGMQVYYTLDELFMEVKYWWEKKNKKKTWKKL